MILPYYIPYVISDHIKPVVLVRNTTSKAYSAVSIDFGDDTGVKSYERGLDQIEYVYGETGTFTMRLSAYFAGGTDIQLQSIKIQNDFDPIDPTTFFDYISATTNNYKLPNNKFKLVQSNDWITADNINAAFTSIYENFEYIEGLCHRPDVRGDEQIIDWLGKGDFIWTHYSTSLIVNEENNFLASDTSQIVQATTDDLEYLSAVGFTNIVDITLKDNTNGNKLYIIDGTHITLLSSDPTATVLLSTNNIQFNKTFNQPNSIDVDSLENIYIADLTNNEVYKFRNINNLLVLQTFIGGLGTIADKYGLNTPNHVRVDSQDRVIISDRENYAIKIYDPLLTWVTTISAASAYGKVVAMAVDKKDDTIYTITESKYLIRYSDEGATIGSPVLLTALAPNILQSFIEFSSNYLFVVCEGATFKFTKDGLFLKQVSVPDSDSQSQNVVVSGRCDEHNQVFIASRSKIFRIDATPPIINIKPYTESHYYTLDDIKIRSGENVEDWVYNKSLTRLVHNHSVFAKNVFGEFVRGVNTANQLEYFVTGVRDFSETLTFEITDDLYVGANEPVLVGTVNRTLETIYDFQERALQSISPKITTLYSTVPTL
jgi:hypothetical protein